MMAHEAFMNSWLRNCSYDCFFLNPLGFGKPHTVVGGQFRWGDTIQRQLNSSIGDNEQRGNTCLFLYVDTQVHILSLAISFRCVNCSLILPSSTLHLHSKSHQILSTKSSKTSHPEHTHRNLEHAAIVFLFPIHFPNHWAVPFFILIVTLYND